MAGEIPKGDCRVPGRDRNQGGHGGGGKDDARARGRRTPYGHRKPRPAQSRGSTPVLGAVDVGTHACRLLVAVPDWSQGGRVPRIIDSYSTSVRLGEGLWRDGRIAPAALDRTIAALKVCAQRMQKRGVTQMRAIATEACRAAANADDLIARAEAEAGIRLIIVSPEEEAGLAAAGASALIDGEADGAIVFDIGGGSTELILMRRAPADADKGERGFAMAGFVSIPLGVVSLADKHGGKNLPASAALAMQAELEAAFRGACERLSEVPLDLARYHLLGTSGTLTTLAGVKLGLTHYDRRHVDGLWLSHEDVRGVLDDVVSGDFEARAAIPCIGHDRADLILPGCAILSTIMNLLPCARLRVADRGPREGLLMAMLQDFARSNGYSAGGHA
jgi:exopolyphosphatase/guanosine-5'-triphosphate,3'-diphosphate pyrophosphatase